MAENTKIPWIERLSMISINPHAATIDDIARMATELSDFDFEQLEVWGSNSSDTGIIENCPHAGEISVHLRHKLSGKTGFVQLREHMQ